MGGKNAGRNLQSLIYRHINILTNVNQSHRCLIVQDLAAAMCLGPVSEAGNKLSILQQNARSCSVHINCLVDSKQNIPVSENGFVSVITL